MNLRARALPNQSRSVVAGRSESATTLELPPAGRGADFGTRSPGPRPLAKRPRKRRNRLHLRLLLLSDVLGALGLAFAVAALVGLGDAVVPPAIALSAPLALAAVGGYGELASVPGAGLRRVGHFFLAAALCTWIAWIASTVVDHTSQQGGLVAVWVLLPLVWWAGRMALQAVFARRREKIVVIGTGPVARRAVGLTERSQRSLELVGVLDDNPLPLGPTGPALLGSIDDLPEILVRYDVDRVLVAFPSRRDGDLLPVLRECDEHGVHVDVVQRFFQYVGLDAQPSAIGDLPVTSVREQNMSRGEQFAKRAFDLLVASLLLLLLAPILLACTAAIMLNSGGSVIFRQERVGRRGRSFLIRKFCTMVDGADAEGLERIQGLEEGSLSMGDAARLLKAEDDPRVTPVGRFLRRTSLDELPQLLNVVRGEMSLVGPRPLRAFEVDRLQMWQLVRHDVRPGITGLWQVLGRSEIEWDERLQLDYGYVRHWSLSSDLRILAETPAAVLRRRGAY